LEQFKDISIVEDSLRRDGERQGNFTVKSAYKEGNTSNFQIHEWPWKLIWKVKILYKVACFTWLLARGSVLTRENLGKRGYPSLF